MKVACEQIVTEAAGSSMIVRPGLIVGPGDPTGRFTYWPARLADTAEWPEVLLPGSSDDAVQVIDVRDLASWIVDSAETRRTGIFDGTAWPATRAAFVEAVAAAARDLGRHARPRQPSPRWARSSCSPRRSSPGWARGSVPLWLPLPEYAGLMTHDPAASYDAGLVTRPISETARDTLLWLDEHPEAVVTGIDRAREAEVLAAWHASRA